MKIISEQINPKSIKDILELSLSYYPKESPNISEEYLYDLYLKNPLGPAMGCYCYEHPKLIGFMALIPVLLSAKNKPRLSYYCVNVLSHPQHRNKNIFISLINVANEFLKKEQSILIGHPNKKAIPFWKRKKMSFQDDIIPGVILPKFFNKTKRLNLKNFEYIISNEFWSCIKENDSNLVKHTREFFKWRHFNRMKQHDVFAIYHNEKVVGLVAYKKIVLGVYLLVDFCCLPDLECTVLSSLPKLTLLLIGINSGIEKKIYRNSFLSKKRIKYFITDFSNGENPVINPNNYSLAASDF